jgi:ubiquinone/menaquinone biosynthesis C-methylase UbiE
MSKHRFDPVHAAKLDDPRRLKSEPPESILDAFALPPARVVVEIGSGSGFYTAPLQRRLAPGGLVAACDVSEKMLAILNQKQLPGIVGLCIDHPHLPFKDQSSDVVFAGNVLHEFDHPLAMLGEAFRILKPGGILGIVDWKKMDMDFGPPASERLEMKEIEALLAGSGFGSIRAHDIVAYHNVISAVREPR